VAISRREAESASRPKPGEQPPEGCDASRQQHGAKGPARGQGERAGKGFH